jgi:hypothetical protein
MLPCLTRILQGTHKECYWLNVWQCLYLRARCDCGVPWLGINGQRTGDSELGPLFFAEVEHGNHSPCCNQYDVLGIKDVRMTTGTKRNVLILIEWCTGAGERQPHLTQLVDLGPHPYADTKKSNANDTLTIPLLTAGLRALVELHGGWRSLYLNGRALAGGGWKQSCDHSHFVHPATCGGAFYSTGANGAVISIPVTALIAIRSCSRASHQFVLGEHSGFCWLVIAAQ